MKLYIHFDSTTLSAELFDNPSSRDFIQLLPITTTLEDYANTEKIFYPERKLDLSGAPSGYKANKGDITYYGPWGDIAIFYKNFSYASGLVPIGKIENNGIEVLQKVKDQEVTFSLNPF